MYAPDFLSCTYATAIFVGSPEVRSGAKAPMAWDTLLGIFSRSARERDCKMSGIATRYAAGHEDFVRSLMHGDTTHICSGGHKAAGSLSVSPLCIDTATLSTPQLRPPWSLPTPFEMSTVAHYFCPPQAPTRSAHPEIRPSEHDTKERGV